MVFERLKANATALYFSLALCVFLLSYVLAPSAKLTNNIFYTLIALPGACILISGHARRLLNAPLVLGWLLFLAWFLLPAAIAGSWQFYKHILYTLLFVLIVAVLTEPMFFRSQQFVRVQFWMLCFYIYVSAFYSWSSGLYLPGNRLALLPARLDNVVYASAWLVSALGLGMPAWVQGKRWIEGVAAVLLAVVAVAFVLQTRTALVGGAFLLCLWLLFGLRHKPRVTARALLAGALVGAAVLAFIYHQSWWHSLWARGDSYRGEILRIMLGEWHNCGWLLGCGKGFHTTQLLAGSMPIMHPHNIFVALGVYTGAPALLLFVVLMGATLRYAWRLRDAWGVFLACSLVMLNFDGSLIIGNPDELWPLVLLPAAMVLGLSLRPSNGRHRQAEKTLGQLA